MSLAISRPIHLDEGEDAAEIVAASLAGPARRHRGTSLALRGVSKAFGGVKAVDDVHIDVAPGEICAIIGPNGAGKSTLLNLVSGICRPDAGGVTVGAAPVVRVQDLAPLGIARTFQNLALFEGLSVAQNVAMGRRASLRAGVVEQIIGIGRIRRERDDLRRRVEAILDFLELTDLRDRAIGGLPYGVRKRIELGRAIVAEPRLLLLDEPLAGMNGADKPDMARFIRTTRDAFGTTIVLIEHDVAIVMDLADRVTVLDYGRKIADGTPEAVRRDPTVIDAYLGREQDEDRHDEARHAEGSP